ncbi:MAG: hypothetical protein HYZ53_18400 [Planctomycetes bacterium]|nr:hypothetical protein [Planctomycetota bacterium]
MLSNQWTKSLLVGAFVALGLVAAAGMILVFKGSRLLTRTYRVHSLWDNIGGMLVGNPVLLAGHQIGKIREIHPPHAGNPREEGKVEVVLEVEERYPLYDYQPLRVISIGMIGDKYVEFGLRLNREAFDRALTDDERRQVLALFLASEPEPTGVLPEEKAAALAARAELGRRLSGPDNLEEVREALDKDKSLARLDKLLAETIERLAFPGVPMELVDTALGGEGRARHDLRERWRSVATPDGRSLARAYPSPLPGKFPPGLGELLDDVGPKAARVLDNLNATLEGLNKNFVNSEPFKEKVHGVLDKVGTSTDKFGKLADDVGAAVGRLKETGGTLDRVDDALDEVREKSRSLGRRADALLATADEDLQSLKKTLDDLGQITRKINEGKGTIGLLVNSKEFHTKTTEFIDASKLTVENVNRFILFLSEHPSALIWGKKDKAPPTLGPVETDWRTRHE